MRSSSVPLTTSTSTPRITAKDQFAEFRTRLIENEEQYKRALEDAKQSYGLMYEDEAKVGRLLDDITNEYAGKELNIYAEELETRGSWINEFGGSSHFAPDIMLLVQTVRMLLERLQYLESKVKGYEEASRVPSKS